MDPSCRVDETTIPTTSVEVEQSIDSDKTGASRTKIAECRFPMSWDDRDVASDIAQFSPNDQSQYSLATLFFYGVKEGVGRTPVMRGFVRGVSGTSKTDVGRAIISDPASLLSAIPYSATYDRPDPFTVFNDVASQFNENSPFNCSVRGVTENPDEPLSFSANEITDAATSAESSTSTERTRLPDTASFHRNRDTLSDALLWVCNQTNSKYYFDFRHEGTRGLSLVYDDGSNATHFTERETKGPSQGRTLNDGGSLPHLGETEVDVIKNTALEEIYPLNTLTVRGETGSSILGHDVAFLPSERFPRATVNYPPFVERAGGQSVARTIETNNVTLESATRTAKQKLEEMIRDSGTGYIEVYGKPNIEPYDTITVKPECADVTTSSVNPLTYSVGNVTHTKKWDSEYRTKIEVTPHFDPSKMEVVSTEMKKA